MFLLPFSILFSHRQQLQIHQTSPKPEKIPKKSTKKNILFENFPENSPELPLAVPFLAPGSFPRRLSSLLSLSVADPLLQTLIYFQFIFITNKNIFLHGGERLRSETHRCSI
jgi:hypothetical protein